MADYRVTLRLGLGILLASLGCGSEDGVQTEGPSTATPPPATTTAGSASPVGVGVAGSAPTGAAGTGASVTAGTGSAMAGTGAPAPSPAAGTGAAVPPGPGTMPMPGGPTTTPTPDKGKPLAMDECGLKTNYDGDNYCIKPPPVAEGFQLHMGPTSYDNPEAKYILMPGQEVTSDFQAMSTNDKPIHFYYRQFRMRPGAHHNIITIASTAGRGFDQGRRIGTSNHLAEDSPAGGIIAPENEGVGIKMEPNTALNVNLHSINTTDKPQLRELWINFWYKDSAKVTDEVEEMFQTGSVTFAVQPHADVMLGPFKCTVAGEGRMLWFYGHRHANNKRFSAWRVRNGQRELFYEGLNWEEPLVLEYSSTVKNTVPDLAAGIEGGWSGILDLKAGDVLEWECHVVNKTDGVLRFTNNTFTGEMCIMDAELVGANCPTGGGGAVPMLPGGL